MPGVVISMHVCLACLPPCSQLRVPAFVRWTLTVPRWDWHHFLTSFCLLLVLGVTIALWAPHLWHRAGHLCEFHGLDLEMTINEHYYEVLDVFSDLFIYIFDELKKRFPRELEAVRAQHPFEDLKVRVAWAAGTRASPCIVHATPSVVSVRPAP